MDDSGHARIADFGLSMVTKNITSTPSARLQHGSTARWAAPELMKRGVYEKEADVFSFAMVMIEVYSAGVLCEKFHYAKTSYQYRSLPVQFHSKTVQMSWPRWL